MLNFEMFLSFNNFPNQNSVRIPLPHLNYISLYLILLNITILTMLGNIYTSQSSSLCNNLIYASSVQIFLGAFCFQTSQNLYSSDNLNDKCQIHKIISNFYHISSS
jgi:hypothetical protein